MRKTKLGQELIKGMSEAVEYTRGKRRLRSEQVSLPPAPRKWTPKKVAALRLALGMAQPAFAAYLGASPGTVRAWEQGDKSPSGAAARLLELLDWFPENTLAMLNKLRERTVQETSDE